MKSNPLFAVIALAGCSFSHGDVDEPALDRDAPRVEIQSPVRGTLAGDVAQVRVTGTASDDSGAVAAVKVNGVPATLHDDGTWTVDINVAPGTSLLRAIAFDANNNQGEQTRAVVAGPMIDIAPAIEDGIRATLSAPALLTLGHNTATFIEAGGLTEVAQGMNPVVDVGSGPDCLYSQASVTSLTAAGADVVTAPTDGGIMLTAVLTDVDVGMHLQWSASCLDGSHDAVMTAERVTVQGLLTIGVVDRKLDIQFADPNVTVVGFDPQLGAVPAGIVQALNLDAAIGPMIGSMTGQLVVPITSRLLTALDDTRTVEVAGVPVEIDVAPTRLTFSRQGGTVELDTTVRARGATGQFVFVPNIAPTLAMTSGFELAITDDAANQLLTSLWTAKAFDQTVAVAGNAFDTAQLQLMVPPHVTASAQPLQLTLGDWVATFTGENIEPATVAIHATTSLYVTTGVTGKLELAVSTPAVRVDIIDGELTKSQYDAIKEFAVERVTQFGSAAVAAFPLPTVGAAVPTNLWVEPASDSMLIVGDLEEGSL